MKKVEVFVTVLPFLVLAVSLAQVVGFIAISEPYLVGAWAMTSVMSCLAIIYKQRWKDAEDRASAEKVLNNHLTAVIERHVDREGDDS